MKPTLHPNRNTRLGRFEAFVDGCHLQYSMFRRKRLETFRIMAGALHDRLVKFCNNHRLRRTVKYK